MKIKKRDAILGILLISILAIIFIQNNFLVSATTTVCAIHTTYGAWCQDVPSGSSQIDNNYPTYTTSCASVADCSGTCVSTTDGLCSASSKYACDPTLGGNYYSTVPSQTPQCQYGCCLLGDQASFTTPANCAVLSSQKGVNLDFDSNVNDEPTCISMAAPEAQGACVYNTNLATTCQFTTRQNCQQMNTGTTKTTFYSNFLCTNPSLGTDCVKTKQTTCLTTSDQVFYVDSCGNPANVYDANQYNNVGYWSYVGGTNGIISAPDSNNNGDIGSANNGNCNYLNGSTCMKYNSAIDSNPPTIGDYLCRDLSCKSGTFVQQFTQDYQNNRQSAGLPIYPVNGETWCGTESNGNGKSIILGGNPGSAISSNLVSSGLTSVTLDKSSDLPGSVDTLFICQNGQITTQSYDARQYVCIQSKTSNGYFSSYRTLNRWQDCYYQNSSKTCLDNTTRDCQWIVGYSIERDPNTGWPYIYDASTDQLVPRASQGDSTPGASCVPKYPPGFDISVDGLLSSSGNLNIQGPSAQDTCNFGSTICYVQYTRSKAASIGSNVLGITGPLTAWQLYGNMVCLDGNENLVPVWETSMSNICSSIGDCGVSINYIGTSGTNQQSDLFKVFKGPPSYD